MEFARDLLGWEFKGREKRFFMYGMLAEQIAHCPNTGSLKGVLSACSKLWVHDHGEDSGRKLRYGAEICELADGTMVGINTMRANGLAMEALRAGLIPEVGKVDEIEHEVKFDKGTRFDLRVNGWWGEVKNTTLSEGAVAMFPDAVTERGQKHVRILREVVEGGGKAMQIYVVPRDDVTTFTPADAIDPAYGEGLRAAAKAGVLVVALGCKVTPKGITVDRRLEIVL